MSAKKLLPFREVGLMDNFLFDSFVTGRQRVKCLGKRTLIKRAAKQVLKGKPEDLPSPGKYIILRQGIYILRFTNIQESGKEFVDLR